MIPTIKIFLLAMTPIGELRLSLPLAIEYYKLSPEVAFFVSFVGNLVPPFFLLNFLEIFSHFLSRKSKKCQKFFLWLFSFTRKRHQEKIEKYKSLGLLFLVALPFPLTGAWTGSLVAFVFGFPKKKAFFLIALGIFLAGLIVLFTLKIGIEIKKYFGSLSLVFLFLMIFAFFFIKKYKRL